MLIEKLYIQCTIVEYKTILENFGARKITEILLSALPKKPAQQSVHLIALRRGLVLSLFFNVILLTVVLFAIGGR